jgi:NodT family efflux transporter outer membrane factor (OMF) lipoprotein
MMRTVITRGIGVSLAALLAGCAVGPDFKRPATETRDSYTKGKVEAQALAHAGTPEQHFASAADIQAEWWTLFGSPALDHLVEQALKANPSIDSAKAALRQAHEAQLAQWTAFLPVATGSFSATRYKTATSSVASPATLPNGGTPPPIFNFYSTEIDLSYTPDIFGGTRRAYESDKAQTENARFQLIAAELTLTGNLISTAVQEASLRAQVAATERLIDVQHELTKVAQEQHGIGTNAGLDILAQEAAEAQTEATLPPLRKQLEQGRDALTALLGKLPADEPNEEFRLADFTLPQELPLSLPSKLVEQRPDVRAAEATLHAETAQVGVAVANMLPQLSITANTGTTGLSPGQMFTPTYGFWTLGSSLSQTLFDAGALLHKRREADAAMDQAAADYRSTVIGAFQNVADMLHALDADAAGVAADQKADDAAKRALDIAERQYRLGTISHVALLNAEQIFLQAELTLVQMQASRLADTAGLFQALGGGWWNRPDDTAGENG